MAVASIPTVFVIANTMTAYFSAPSTSSN